MKLNCKKIIISIILLCLFVPFISKAEALLKDEAKQKIDSQTTYLTEKAGIDTGVEEGKGLANIVATVINAFFALLAIIFIIYIILAGYSWMSAQGDDQKVKDAKDTIRNAIIGLIIIMAAYSITYFVFQKLDESSSGGGTYTSP